jgi:hypothetical protein
MSSYAGCGTEPGGSIKPLLLSDAIELANRILQMEVVLNHVAKRAPFTLPPEAAKKIIDDSGGNLRKAILVLEALKMQSYAH